MNNLGVRKASQTMAPILLKSPLPEQSFTSYAERRHL